jgi:hypothetical protein
MPNAAFPDPGNLGDHVVDLAADLVKSEIARWKAEAHELEGSAPADQVNARIYVELVMHYAGDVLRADMQRRIIAKMDDVRPEDFGTPDA